MPEPIQIPHPVDAMLIPKAATGARDIVEVYAYLQNIAKPHFDFGAQDKLFYFSDHGLDLFVRRKESDSYYFSRTEKDAGRDRFDWTGPDDKGIRYGTYVKSDS